VTPGGRSFLQGLVAGAAVATGAGVLAGALLFTPEPVSSAFAGWVERNLGLAAGAFLLVLLAWLVTLLRLRAALAAGGPAERISHLDGLADVWVGLFFGVGVIWTAVGMRAALLHAIGPGAEAIGGPGMLARLVDGGILLALSSTIAGGIGGYVMRVIRSLWLGPALRRFYRAEAGRELAEIRTVLAGIHDRLGRPGYPAAGGET